MEKFIQWTPLPNVMCEFSLGTLLAEEGRVSVGLAEETGRTLRVDFQAAIAYRVVQRDFAIKRILDFETGREGFGALWTVENSAWAEELGLAGENKTHYFFSATSEIIEVLTVDEPHIAWMDSFFGDAF